MTRITAAYAVALVGAVVGASVLVPPGPGPALLWFVTGIGIACALPARNPRELTLVGALVALVIGCYLLLDGVGLAATLALVAAHEVITFTPRLALRWFATRNSRRRRRRADLTQLLQGAPHGAAVIDPAGQIRAANPTLARLLKPGASLVGDDLGAYAVDGGRSLRILLADAVVATDHAAADVTVTAATGEVIDLALTATRVRTNDGDPELLVHAEDVSVPQGQVERLAYLADHDPLTGLTNRRAFETALQHREATLTRDGVDSALLLVGLDGFHHVNGVAHAVGDDLLRSVAAMLRRALRRTDIVARLGGDEFAILLPATDRDSATRIADFVVERVRSLPAPTPAPGVQAGVTASIGVLTLADARAAAGDPLVLADRLMRDAKDRGRDARVVIDPADPPRMGTRQAIRARIEQALGDRGFELHLEPVRELRSCRIVGAHVVLRLRDGDELVTPGRFLPEAKQAGLLGRIDLWVVREAVRLLRQMQAIDPGFTLTAALVGPDLGSSGYVDDLVAALDASPVMPGTFVLELPERAAVADLRAARNFGQRLAEHDARLALHDSGAGFGSYYLKHLDFDFLKIAGHFVANLHDSHADQSIVRSLVGIAHDLGKRTVADHVGDDRALSAARRLGVDFAQGFGVGQPMGAGDFLSTVLLPPGRGVPAALERKPA
ncbi:MAG: EAL domain-containing protein [Propionibacteriaceae bacterium]|nr:EAL domain-containing protein [Propionibacteriaceae bacterium]